MNARAFTTKLVLCLLAAVVVTPLLAQTTGTIYVNTNQVTNEVWSYTRAADGTLTFAGKFATQGKGTGGNNLESQGSILISQDGKYVVAANPGSNEITSFSVQPGGQLTFVSKVRSGGTYPVSLANFGTLVYVLNSRGTSNINAFRLKNGGVLKQMLGTKRTLSSSHPSPAQVGFSKDGTILVVTELDTNKIDSFTIDAEGMATGPLVQDSSGPAPFGFAFDNAGHLIVSEATNSAMSSYSVSPTGVLTLITGSLVDFGKAACWVVNTNNPAFTNQFSYTTNTNNNTISGFTILPDGSLTLVNANGRTAVLPRGADPLDMALSSDSQYMYAQEGRFGGIVGFQIQPDGNLVQVTSVTGIPASQYGMIGN